MRKTVSVFSLPRAAAIGALALLLAAPPAVSHAQSRVDTTVSPPDTRPTIKEAFQLSGSADTATVRMEWDEPDIAAITAYLNRPRTGFCYTVEEFVLGISQGNEQFCRNSDDTHVEFDVTVPPKKLLGLRVRTKFEDESGTTLGTNSSAVSVEVKPGPVPGQG